MRVSFAEGGRRSVIHDEELSFFISREEAGRTGADVFPRFSNRDLLGASPWKQYNLSGSPYRSKTAGVCAEDDLWP